MIVTLATTLVIVVNKQNLSNSMMVNTCLARDWSNPKYPQGFPKDGLHCELYQNRDVLGHLAAS